MKKKVLSLLVSGIFVLGALTGCGGAAASSENVNEAGITPAQVDADTEVTEADKTDSGELTPITIAASPTPHSEILAQAKEFLRIFVLKTMLSRALL